MRCALFEQSSGSLAPDYQCVRPSPQQVLLPFVCLTPHQGGSVHLDGCDITSSSGVGVGVEGAAVQLTRCRVHDCERHGVAVFGSLEGEQVPPFGDESKAAKNAA